MAGAIDSGAYGNPVIAKLGINGATYQNQIALNNHEVSGTDKELKEMILKGKNLEDNLDLKDTFLDKEDSRHKIFMDAYAAMHSLQKKHGDEYMLPILGLRKPKYPWEYLNLWAFGKFPKEKN